MYILGHVSHLDVIQIQVYLIIVLLAKTNMQEQDVNPTEKQKIEKNNNIIYLKLMYFIL